MTQLMIYKEDDRQGKKEGVLKVYYRKKNKNRNS